MKISAPLLLIISATFISTGCKDEHSEAWYKEHPEETYVTYTECLKNGEVSDNCEFSHRAAIMFAQIGKPGTKEKFADLFQQKEANQRKFTQQ